MNSYKDKFNNSIKNTLFKKLSNDEQEFIKQKAYDLKFSHQEIKQIVDMARDLVMWNEKNIIEIFPDHKQKKVVFTRLRKAYQEIKNTPNTYKDFILANNPQEQKYSFNKEEKDGFGLGLCPVASEKTRCCNLLTLDAVESCGFDCSYCSIQSFYNQNKITFDSGFADKLKNLKLDKNKTYHIGTGQSSDSLMWGNREGVLDALFEFAREYPNVILEFKTKSDNIKYLLENDVPKNIFCTWSLNPQVIVENEEQLTASLDKRLASARAVANKGVKVGFHFHPIVEYEGYLDDYNKVYQRVLNEFKSDEVALISFGTLTFIKPVIKKLRERNFKSKITQMPFEDAGGKSSYPLEIKREMFKHAYNSFRAWHDKDVFFYMCMEDQSLWKEVFGYEYATNNDFEKAMLHAYSKKIGLEYLI